MNKRQLWDLRRDAVTTALQLQDKLMRAGLYKTYHIFDATIKSIGYEMAELGAGPRCPIKHAKPGIRR